MEFGRRQRLLELLDSPYAELICERPCESAPSKKLHMILAGRGSDQFQHALPPGCRLRGVVGAVQEHQRVGAGILKEALDIAPADGRGRVGGPRAKRLDGS